jgi:hypothetical protein
MNLLYPNNLGKWVPNVVISWVLGQWILFAMEALM